MILEKLEDCFSRWNEGIKQRLAALCPPGYELKGEYRVFWGWMIVSMIYSLRFLVAYYEAYDRLFRWKDGVKILNPQMKMPQFESLLAGSLDGFLLGGIFLLMVWGMHYSYYRRESKSIYFMKRLGKSRILWKTYFATPAIYGCILLITALFLWVMYYGIYRWLTPAECLIL